MTIEHADQPCFIMASTGETVTYGEFETRANQLAHLLRDTGLSAGAHYAIFMENNAHYLMACAAGERAGLYYTCINSYLSAAELAFIVNDSQAQVVVTSRPRRDIAQEAMRYCPNVRLHLIVDGTGDDGPFIDYERCVSAYPGTPIADESLGRSMLYSSGTTGRPKGILKPLPGLHPAEISPYMQFLSDLWQYREGMVYLSPAPLYHSAPQAAVNLALRKGSTCIIMERFDAAEYLSLVERYRVTHSQLVPTMFSRLLKLPAAVRERCDVSSLEAAVHAAAPCPEQVKHAMIQWWGPVIHEYYGATEGLGFTACDTAQWLAHPGTVGNVRLGELHILDDDFTPCPAGTSGTIWFKSAAPFEYFNDPEKTAEAHSPDGALSTVHDVGYVDAEGYLYLTDRKTYMIISGGVNIYPQECENLLITHPKVADAAVFGVPNDDLGEEVKAVVQLEPNIVGDAVLAQALIEFCRLHLAHLKCPRSVDFAVELPRLPTGKLYKRLLRDRYWAHKKSRLV